MFEVVKGNRQKTIKKWPDLFKNFIEYLEMKNTSVKINDMNPI